MLFRFDHHLRDRILMLAFIIVILGSHNNHSNDYDYLVYSSGFDASERRGAQLRFQEEHTEL